MSEPEVSHGMQPEEQEPMEQGGIPPPTNGPPPNPVEPLVQGLTITTRPGGAEGRYVCQTCGKSFNSKAELDMHVESQHAQAQTQRSRQKATRPRRQSQSKSQSRSKTTRRTSKTK